VFETATAVASMAIAQPKTIGAAPALRAGANAEDGGEAPFLSREE
jgi:hypothetical protein